MVAKPAIATTFISTVCLILAAFMLTWAQHQGQPQLQMWAVITWGVAGLLFVVWAVLAARNLK